MLQIIGWLGCVYLIVKGLELYGTRSQSGAHLAGAVVAWIAAPIFFLAFFIAGLDLNPQYAPLDTSGIGVLSEQDRQSLHQNCMAKATNKEQRSACRGLLETP